MNYKTQTTSTRTTALSLFFIRKARVTILISLALILLGYFSYTTLLKREGFPSVEVPIAIVQSKYFVGDPALIDKEITTPIEAAIKDVADISKVTSTTSDNFSTIIVQFSEGISSKAGLAEVEKAVARSVQLPEGATVDYSTIDAGALDGDHNFIFSLSSEQSIAEMQTKAEFVASQMQGVKGVARADVIKQISQEKNPVTGETFDYQSSFNRIGIKEDGKLVFKPAVSIGIVQKKDVGSIDLSRAVREKVSELIKSGELDGYQVQYGGDMAIALNKQIGSLQENAVAAAATIIIILILFINWRAALILAIFLILSLAAVFLALYLIGYSLNVISLFGLILVLGLFVDDGTIVVEAIDYYKKQGLRGIAAVRAAVNDIGAADIAGTLTTILVFLPMVFISGVLGEFIRLIPITVILALGLSLIIALTVLPFLSAYILPDRDDRPLSTNRLRRFGRTLFTGFGRGVIKAGDWAGSVVAFYLSKVWLSVVILIASLVLMGFGASYASKLKFSVFPSPDDTEEISVSISYPPGYDISKAQSDAAQVDNVIAARAGDHIETASYYFANQNSAYISILLTELGSRDKTSNEIVADLNDGFAEIAPITAKAAQVSSGPPSSDYPFMMQVYGADVEALKSASDDIIAFLRDREIEPGQKITDVRLVKHDTISKANGRRYVEIQAKVTDATNTGSLLKIQDQVKERYTESELQRLNLAKDALGFDLGQESENLESFNSAILALLVALILMYGLLLLKFDSFLQPILIFLAMPFAIPGIFPGLYYTHNTLSFFVMIGLIALAGIVVNNTIILVEYANHARRDGLSIREAISRAVQIRFRPIVTTSATTIVALLPLGLSDPFWESLTFTIIFGLISSVILAIFAFPVFYVIFEKIRTIAHRLFRGIGE